ncbi:MAG TPA: DUF302 domain-containing protein [Anaerolineae bacterium]|nr:DUF302 domain-containing protein [Anaerolineae bacterium]HIP72817.1 DUF302 domain-containing protein [Anaerolineae bacterium]
MSHKDYGFRKQVDYSYEEAIEKITAALKEQGFGILTTIDMKATFKKKLDIDTRQYILLGACNPVLANRAVTAELEIGLLLPCNVIVYVNDDGKTVVSIVDPEIMLGVVGNAELNDIALEAKERLEKALAAI